MNSPANELQKALFAYLSGHPAFDGVKIIGRGSVPDLPAIRFGPILEAADDLDTRRIHSRVFVDLHAFVRETGATECRTIMANLRAALRDWLPTLTGMTCIDIRYDRQRVMRDASDPGICHGVISFEALVEYDLEEVLP